jgi:hypothetical protein
MIVSMARFFVILLPYATLLGGCTVAGNYVVDHWPRMAGGEPAAIPPRPGTPEYDEFRKQQEARGIQYKAATAEKVVGRDFSN